MASPRLPRDKLMPTSCQGARARVGSVITDSPKPVPRLGFTVTETPRPPAPVEPDPFIARPAPAGGATG